MARKVTGCSLHRWHICCRKSSRKNKAISCQEFLWRIMYTFYEWRNAAACLFLTFSFCCWWVVLFFKSPFLYFVFEPSRTETLIVDNTGNLATVLRNHFVDLSLFSCTYFWFCYLISCILIWEYSLEGQIDTLILPWISSYYI